MKENQTHQPLQIEVLRDGEPDFDYMPTRAETALTAVHGLFTTLTAKARENGREIVYDAIHGTNYHSIKRELLREKRNRDWEASIGLQRLDK